MNRKPTYEELEQRVKNLEKEVLERNQAEKDRHAHLSFLENADRIDRVIRDATNVEQMMEDVLGTALSIFHCDRTWLIYPCDPKASFWSVPMERTVPEYPGAFALGENIPTTSDMEMQFKAALESDEPLAFDPETGRPLPDSARQFSTRSSMIMAIYPKTSKPWLWGLSQCSHARVWTKEENQLFKEVGHRMADALSSLLILRDLRESEARFRGFMDSATEGFSLWDSNLNLLEINTPGLMLLPSVSKKEEIIGKHILEIIPWLEDTDRYEKYLDVIKSGEPLFLEDASPSARFGTLNLIIKAFKAGGGLGMIVVDITEQKQAEENLKKGIEYFQLHSDLANTLIKIHPREFGKTIEYLLGRVVEFFGVDRGVLVYWPEGDPTFREIYTWKEKGIKPYRPPVPSEEFPFLVKTVMNGEIFLFSDAEGLPSEAENEKAYFLKEGTKSTIIIPLMVEDKVLGTLICASFRKRKTWTDDQIQRLKLIAQTFSYSLMRKHSVETLRESEDKLRAIFDNVNDEIVYLDSQGTVLDVNRRVEDIFGYKPEEVIGKNFSEFSFSLPDSIETLMKQFDVALSGSINKLTEIKGIRKDGTEVQLEPSTSIIKKSGEITNILTIIRDITERKKLEAQLQHAHKMEAIGTLAGGIAHEFNNILGIIVGHTELAMDGVPDWNPARYNLDEIRTACLRARDVVRQILAFSRQTQQELKPVRLGKIVKDSLKLLRSSIPTTVEIRWNISGDSDTVNADPTQINQILINLCTNAAYAMRDQGGILDIRLENITLDEDSVKVYHDLLPGNFMKLTVHDTGRGIKPEVIERIFDPYFTTKEVGEGTGMGLSVVHGIVKNHGGDVTVSSEPDKGTTFSILLPVVETETEPQIDSKTPLPMGDERILFVDDEKSLVLAARNYLVDLGYEVTAERDPARALEVFKEKPETFDLLITDMSMPHMTGDRLAKEIMKIRPDIPIILCTGFSEQISEAKAKEMGIIAFIMKPALVQEMAKTIRTVLDKGKEL